MIIPHFGVRGGTLIFLALFAAGSLLAKATYRAVDLGAWGVGKNAHLNDRGDIVAAARDSNQGLVLHRQPGAEPRFTTEVVSAPAGYRIAYGSSNNRDIAFFSLVPEQGLIEDTLIVWPDRSSVRLNELLVRNAFFTGPMALYAGHLQDSGLFIVSSRYSADLHTVFQLDESKRELAPSIIGSAAGNPRALNNRGHVLRADGLSAASPSIEYIDPVPVSYPEYFRGYSTALNDSDVTVGSSEASRAKSISNYTFSSGATGFVMSPTGSSLLPTRGDYGAYPTDVNDYQEVVGYWLRKVPVEDGLFEGEQGGFFVWRSGVLQDLDAGEILTGTGYDSLTSVSSINNRGEILAQARRQDGTGEGAVLLVPEKGEALPGLSNLSSRNRVDERQPAAIIGFTVTGDRPVRALLRAVGQGLQPFGVSDWLTNPSLRLYRGSEYIVGNDDWGGGPEMQTQSERVGAFPLSSRNYPGHAYGRDAALLVALEPGSYTLHATSSQEFTETEGTVLLEVYALPD